MDGGRQGALVALGRWDSALNGKYVSLPCLNVGPMAASTTTLNEVAVLGGCPHRPFVQ